MPPAKTAPVDCEILKTMAQGRALRSALVDKGLFQPTRPEEAGSEPATGNDLWRIATRPFYLSKKEEGFLRALGGNLLAFYQAANRLYFDSVRGRAPRWVADYLDQGKPEAVVEMGRMNRFKQELPGIIRPDLIPTPSGFIASELDSIPGGIGLTAALYEAYAVKPETDKPGNSHGNGQLKTVETNKNTTEENTMVVQFEKMIRAKSDKKAPILAIVVSEESKDYRTEMQWLAKRLFARGLETWVIEPKDLLFSEEGLTIESGGQRRRIDILYRFFELFDLKNIPKSELMLYAAKKKQVALTPPPKAHLEEKSLFALFHHPVLRDYWLTQLGEERKALLDGLFPLTWMLDPRPLPPHALIPNLTIKGTPMSDFRALGSAGQKERQFAIKASGFSELAWGSRGVSVGHDLSEADWRIAIDQALASFERTPYILQNFHKGKKVSIDYYDFDADRPVTMEGRARLSPYYFVEGNEARLGGVLATVCSLEKKLIHGMVDAVIAPCAFSEEAGKTMGTINEAGLC